MKVLHHSAKPDRQEDQNKKRDVLGGGDVSFEILVEN
jgi:hypothetical protein